MLTGLCSVTFRNLDVDGVLAAASRGSIDAIEWGADVHVRPGDLDHAATVRDRTCRAGIVPASYGSYLQCGRAADEAYEQRVIDTACALGATNVRVWANGGGRDEVIGGLRRFADRAAANRLQVSVEFHPGTETETAASTIDLLARVDAKNVATYWQPHPDLDDRANLTELGAVVPYLAHLHVFRWLPDRTRLPLADGVELWSKALESVASVDRVDRVAFLEFVRDDDVDQFVADARTLREWVR